MYLTIYTDICIIYTYVIGISTSSPHNMRRQTHDHVPTSPYTHMRIRIYIYQYVIWLYIKICYYILGRGWRRFSTIEPLNLGQFCGKWPIKIRDPMSLRHPAAPLRPSRLLTIYAGKLTTISPPHPINTCTYMYVNQYVLDSMYTCLYIHVYTYQYVVCVLLCLRCVERVRLCVRVCCTV